QRDPLVCDLDRVRVAELVGGEASPNAGRSGGVLELLAGRGRFPVPSAGRAVDHAEQRADRQARSDLKPRLELLPGPAVHPDLAALAALAAADEDRAARSVEVGLGESERFTDSETGAPEEHDQGAKPEAVRPLAGGPHDGDDLVDRRRVGRIPHAFVARRATLVVAGHRGWRAAVAGGVDSDGLHRSTSYC